MAQNDKNWALLIGINDYSSLNIRSLNGCVKDVDDQERWLTSTARIVPAENVIRLTTKEGDLPPTYDNIWAKLQHLRDRAEAGAMVFIHYSGHGSRRPTVLPQNTENKTVDEILVFQKGYLRDFELGAILDEIAKNRTLFVVLDCCHSAGADRDDDEEAGVRGISVASARLEESFAILDDQQRPIQVPSETWWEQPRDYTLLAACRPHQTAKEREYSASVNGNLTYWLLRSLESLRRGDQPFSYQTLYRDIYSNLVEDGIEQHPAILGQCLRVPFTKDLLPLSGLAFINKIAASDRCIQLDVGQAHCISEGTRYAVYGRSSNSTFNLNDRIVAEVTINNVGGLSSYAGLPSDFDLSRISRGCTAKLTSPGTANIVHIGLTYEGQYNEQSRAVRILEKALRQCSHLPVRIKVQEKGVIREPDIDFHVRIANGHYYILDQKLAEIPHVQPVPINGIWEAEKVHELIHYWEHSWRIRRLKNPCSDIDGSFSFRRASRETGDVAHGREVKLQLRNTSSGTLYFCVLNLRPLGGIKQLVPKIGQGVRSIERNITRDIRIKITMPDELLKQGVKRARTTFKVIVVNNPSFFETHQSTEFLNDDYDDSKGTSRRLDRHRNGEVVEDLECADWQTEEIDIWINNSS
ncbi:Metacaspase-1 [Arthrobotrys entomopaga]|nr:Metacaspase-1 [Arthrobotrys entomopaga]